MNDPIDQQELSWKPHSIRQWDGRGGEVCHPAKFRFVPQWQGLKVTPYGLAQMDNGEIALIGVAYRGNHEYDEKTVIGFSGDGGATWSAYQPVEGHLGRPTILTYLGRGELTFASGRGSAGGGNDKYFSHDYGRTWQCEPRQLASNGEPFNTEGNALVDRDANGHAERIAEAGCNLTGEPWPFHTTNSFLRWSSDGGHTWENESQPEAWHCEDTYKGHTVVRGCTEGSLVRAANGDIVAALRLGMRPHYREHPFCSDNFESTAVSISKDDGRTWSPIREVLPPGRMHATLNRLESGDLVMTVIRRIDIRDGKLATYRRGCEAVISRDHGRTWDVDRTITVDDFAFCDERNWVASGESMIPKCGHQYSIALTDGSILTGYGNYSAGGVLIHWEPPTA